MKTNEINFRKLEEENAHFLSSLPKKDQEDILDVHRYISNYQMEQIESEALKKDLIQIALDANDREEDFLSAIGDKATFAKEIADNYVKRPLPERIIQFLSIFLPWLLSLFFLYGGNGYITITQSVAVCMIGYFFLLNIFVFKLDNYLKVVKGRSNSHVGLIRAGSLALLLMLGKLIDPNNAHVLVKLPNIPVIPVYLVILAAVWGLRLYFQKKHAR